MSLYLCIFDDADDEIEGFQLGHYSDFAAFRATIAKKLPPAEKQFPILMSEPDDDEWALSVLPKLIHELRTIADRFKSLPPEAPVDAFEFAAECRAGAKSLYDCFHNVDDENLFEALIRLCETGIKNGRPIMFQ